MKQIAFIFFFFVTFVNAQVKGDVYDDEGDGRKLTQVEFKRATVLYDKMVASDDFIEKNNLLDKLFLIVSKNSYPQKFLAYEENINEQKIQDWVNKNVPSKSINEATKTLSRIVFLKNKMETENHEIIQILKYKASFNQCEEIMKPNLRDK